MFKGHAARGVAFAFVVADRRAPVSAPLGVPPRRPRGCQGATCRGQVGVKPVRLRCARSKPRSLANAEGARNPAAVLVAQFGHGGWTEGRGRFVEQRGYGLLPTASVSASVPQYPAEAGGAVVIVAKGRVPAPQQTWEISGTGNGRVTIRCVGTSNYLAVTETDGIYSTRWRCRDLAR